MRTLEKRAWPTMAAVVALATLATSACERSVQLETRTFALEHLGAGEASELVRPYIYTDRPQNQGTLSAVSGALTVRETPDNLDRIARVLEEYDVGQPDLRLHFQLIEADGFSETDPAIAEVVGELRKLFRFQGYRLMGDAVVTTADGGHFSQRVVGTDEAWMIRGALYRPGAQGVRLEDVQLIQDRQGTLLQTSATVRKGQTLVLGSTPRADGSQAGVILTLKVEEVGPGGE